MTTKVLARALTDYQVAALYALGQIYIDFSTGKIYRYVEMDGALAANALTANQALSWMDDGFEVVNDISEGLGVNAPAGVAINACPEAYFSWIQIAGQCTLFGDGSVAAGECVVLHSVDGTCDTMAAGEYAQVLAIALTADAGDPYPFTAQLRGLM